MEDRYALPALSATCNVLQDFDVELFPAVSGNGTCVGPSADAAEKIEVGSDIRESASPEVTNSGYEKHPRSLLIQRAAGWSVDIL